MKTEKWVFLFLNMDGIYNCKVNIYKSRVSLCFYLNLASNCCVRRKFFWKIIQLIPNRHLYLTLPANYQIMLVDSWVLRAWMSCLLACARARTLANACTLWFIYLFIQMFMRMQMHIYWFPSCNVIHQMFFSLAFNYGQY